MNFSLQYSGPDGYLSAALLVDSKTIATTTGLLDKKAALKWAQREARDHKVANTPEATEHHSVQVSGSSTFTL